MQQINVTRLTAHAEQAERQRGRRLRRFATVGEVAAPVIEAVELGEHLDDRLTPTAVVGKDMKDALHRDCECGTSE